MRDDSLVIDVEDLSVELDIDYEFISDPPVFADIGTMENKVSQFDLQLSMTSTYEDNDVTLQISELLVDIKEFDIIFDGVSDFSTVVTSLVDKVLELIWAKIERLI